MHGGLSPDLLIPKMILGIERPTDISDTGLLVDLLWSDPKSQEKKLHLTQAQNQLQTETPASPLRPLFHHLHGLRCRQRRRHLKAGRKAALWA